MSVCQFLDASTAHLSKEEAEQLRDGIDHLCVDAHEYGWWVWVDLRPVPGDEDDQALRATCPNLAAVLDHARTLGCGYVRLDADGATLDGLPTFQW